MGSPTTELVEEIALPPDVPDIPELNVETWGPIPETSERSVDDHQLTSSGMLPGGVPLEALGATAQPAAATALHPAPLHPAPLLPPRQH